MQLRTIHLMPDDRPLVTHQHGPVIRQPIGPIPPFADRAQLDALPGVTYRASGAMHGARPVYVLEGPTPS